jgi:tetratricopeptide (TPR) repeat protein
MSSPPSFHGGNHTTDGVPGAERGPATLVAEARLADALEALRGAPEGPDHALVRRLLSLELPAAKPGPWRAALLQQPGDGSEAMQLAARRYLARGLARASELQDGRGALVEGEPVGRFLLDAALPDEAAASLYATLSKKPGSGKAALLLANALHRLERHEEARDAYRRAFRVAPLELPLDGIEDAEVRGLCGLAEPLRLDGDVRAWLPAIGYLEDVLPLSALDPVPGAGFGDASRVYDLIVAHKGARSHPERLAIRRDLRDLAPPLFDALVAARKLDATPPPAGSA